MNAKNRRMIRLKRSKIQQSVISVCCMLLMIFSLAWTLDTAATSKGYLFRDNSSVVGAGAKADEKKPATDSKVEEDSTKLDESKAESTADKKNDASNDDKDESNVKSGELESITDEDIDDEFEDAAFIGDSRTVGLQMNTNIPKASFYASIGLNISTALSEPQVDLANGNKGTVLQGMQEKQFKRIYIMFGINELGWPNPDIFQEQYEELVTKIKELQPDATVYLQSILPVSYKALETNSVFTNENVDSFNELVKAAAENTKSEYLDVASVFKDANGALPEEASTDGIHLVHDYCNTWLKYIADNT